MLIVCFYNYYYRRSESELDISFLFITEYLIGLESRVQQKLYTIKSIVNLRVEQVSLKVFEKFVIINNNSKGIIQLQHQLQIH